MDADVTLKEPSEAPTESFGQIAAALAKAQAGFKNPPRNKEVKVNSQRGAYSFKYATLDAILDAVRKPLSDAGLCVVQIPGKESLETRLIHDSGECLSSRIPLFVSQQGAQAYGSALTYARRYALAAMLGIAADEDDDGNAADGNQIEQSREIKPNVRKVA